MRAVETKNIDVTFNQRRAALDDIAGDTYAGRDPQPSELVLAGVRVIVRLFDVLDRDQTLEIALLVDHEELFDAVLVEQYLGLVEGRPDRRGHQVFFGHEIR